MRPFLYVTPYFPPSTALGGKRALTLARRLPAHGWLPVVLAAPPLTGSTDPSLRALVPAGVPVAYEFRGGLRPLVGPVARWLHRGAARERAGRRAARPFARAPYLTPLDQYAWDIPGAVRAGARLVRTFRPAAIVVGADPWSGLVVGRRLSRRFGLPLVADLRDPWSIFAVKMARRPALVRAIVRRLERRFFRAAARIVVNSQTCRDAYRERYRGVLPPERFVAIRSAADPDLFDDGVEPAGDAFTVHYFGSFRDFVPGAPLLEGFARFVRERALGPAAARLVFYGERAGAEAAHAERLGVAGHVDWRPALPLRASLRALRAASVLAVIVAPEAVLLIPSKLWDYLAAGRPILAVSASLEIDDIVTRTGAGIAVPYHDPARIAAGLAVLFERRHEKFHVPPAALEPFGAAEMSRRFADVLTEAAGA